MTISSAPASPGSRFSTEDFAQAARVEAWREIVGRTIMHVAIEPHADAPFSADMTFRSLPGLAVSRGTCSRSLVRHAPAAAATDIATLTVSLGAGHVVRQRGREAVLRPGEAALCVTDDPLDVEFPGHERYIAFSVPMKTMAPMVRDVGAALARPARHSEALRLLVGYGRRLLSMPPQTDGAVGRLAASHIQELIALALGATRDAAESAGQRSVADVRLDAIEVDIVEHIADPGLSLPAVARRHGVTPRYVQMLFDRDGTSFTEFVLREPLARAHRMLTARHLATRSVTSVAFDVGFNDSSYFGRVFRRRYGATPSEVRAAALAQGDTSVN